MAGPSSPAAPEGPDDASADSSSGGTPSRSGLFSPSGAASGEEASDDDESGGGKKEERERTRRRLLAPIGRLYALAQALTESEREARRLVEATYARAGEALAAREGPPPPDLPEADDARSDDARSDDVSPSDSDARGWLFALLVETARDAPDDEAAPPGDAATASAEDATDRHFRRRAQERFLRRALPPAFATLAPGQRLLLTLCDVEDLSFAEAADVADLTEDGAREKHTNARADLREALRQMAPRPERPFLEDDALPDDRLRAALRRMAERDLTAPPPALRPAARHALHHDPGAAARERAASEGRAADRPARSSSKDADRPAWRQPLPRLLVALLLIVGAGAVGYLTTTMLGDDAATTLAALSAERASEANMRLRTDRPERAEQFVRDELGRPLTVPRIDGAVLRGVGLAKVAPGERVPVFRFRDSTSGRPVTAYAYDYALLDRTGERFRLVPRLRRQIQKEGRFATQQVDDHRVLLWRHRDDIFAAVTAHPDSLQQRIAV